MIWEWGIRIKRPPQPIIDKLTEAAQELRNHRYSASRGIYNLRREVSWHYERRFGVDIDPNEETLAVIGTKEGLGHLALALIDNGDLAMVPNPTFPIHMYSIVLAGGSVVSIPLTEENDFIPSLTEITRDIWPRPKVLILSFPHNPTGAVVDLGFFGGDRCVRETPRDRCYPRFGLRRHRFRWLQSTESFTSKGREGCRC